MIEYLYMGVTRSIEFSGNSDNDTLAERKYLLETKIRKLKDLLVWKRKIMNKFDEMLIAGQKVLQDILETLCKDLKNFFEVAVID